MITHDKRMASLLSLLKGIFVTQLLRSFRLCQSLADFFICQLSSMHTSPWSLRVQQTSVKVLLTNTNAIIPRVLRKPYHHTYSYDSSTPHSSIGSPNDSPSIVTWTKQLPVSAARSSFSDCFDKTSLMHSFKAIISLDSSSLA